jgi:hypothetical protein
MGIHCSFAEFAERTGTMIDAEGYSVVGDLCDGVNVPLDEDVRPRILAGKSVSAHDRLLALLDETPALRTALVRLEDTGPRAGRKGPAEVTRLSWRHLHPPATALALVTDCARFPVTIGIASTLTHAVVSWA